MNIHETFHFDNSGEVVRFPWLRRFFLTLVILLTALLSFGVGRLTRGEGTGVSINYDPSLSESKSLTASSPAPVASATGQVTASSQGTRYYYSHCKSTVSEKNKVTFASAAMAEKAGYTLAANCAPR